MGARAIIFIPLSFTLLVQDKKILMTLGPTNLGELWLSGSSRQQAGVFTRLVLIIRESVVVPRQPAECRATLTESELEEKIQERE